MAPIQFVFCTCKEVTGVYLTWAYRQFMKKFKQINQNWIFVIKQKQSNMQDDSTYIILGDNFLWLNFHTVIRWQIYKFSCWLLTNVSRIRGRK